MRAAKGVLRYLRRTTRLGEVYSGSKPLQGFVDADCAGEIDGRRSATGFVFTCNGGAIAWASERQLTVATSTAEAEYVAAEMATKDALWLRKLLSALGVDGGAVAMGEDNQSCLVGGRAQGDTLVPHERHNGDTIRQSVARESRMEAKCVADGNTTGALQRRICIRIAYRFVRFLA